MEATRIRLVSDPKARFVTFIPQSPADLASFQFAPGMISGLTKIARTEGAASLYAGFLPLICKQIPYAIGQVRRRARFCKTRVRR